MNTFQIHYRNTQGTLMRILNAVSRRGLDMPYVHAEAVHNIHVATITLEVTAKQIGQLFRDWHAIVDVIDVSTGAQTSGGSDAWTGSHPAASVPNAKAMSAAIA